MKITVTKDSAPGSSAYLQVKYRDASGELQRFAVGFEVAENRAQILALDGLDCEMIAIGLPLECESLPLAGRQR